jgi:hypothetical protein
MVYDDGWYPQGTFDEAMNADEELIWSASGKDHVCHILLVNS